MVLEASLICLDNSEYMRNGDYTPSRLDAQNDAVILISGAKTESNPENTVGIMTCAGKRPEVLVTLSQDLGKILNSVHNASLSGTLHFSESLQVAQLALKHRQNKNQKQRIICFVGSPIEEDEKELVKLAKKLKKNNVGVDVVNFGEEAENTAKLEAFIAAVNSSDNSHLLTVPPGPHILSDILVSSPILMEDGVAPAAVGGGAGGGGAGFEFGVDPNIDPELALALRISMEEERARQERMASEQKKPEGEASSAAPVAEVKPTGGDVHMEDLNEFQAEHPGESFEAYDEEALLAQAIAMSMAEGQMQGGGEHKDTEMSDEDELQRALAMSNSGGDSSASDALQDPQLLGSILSTLPGVDPNDPRIKSVLEGLSGEKKDEDKSKDKEGSGSK